MPCEAIQEEFVSWYENALTEALEDKIHLLFYDPVHQLHNTISQKCWQTIGGANTVVLPSNTGRKRITIMGAMNPVNYDLTSLVLEGMVDKDVTNVAMMNIREKYSDEKKIVIVMDNAKYNKAYQVQDYAKSLNIEIKYLPPYAPNLNLYKVYYIITHKLLIFAKKIYMGRKVMTLKNYRSEDIRKLFNTDDKYKIGLRLYAVYQVSLGQSSRKLEELYNTSFKQISNWVHRFDKEGLDGLRDKQGRGRKPRLSQEQRKKLEELMEKESPMDYGYNTVTWTGPLLIDWIEQHFNIKYKKAQIYNIIKSLGFSYQKSRGIYPETDTKAQEDFKEGLKKTFRKS